MFHQYYAECHVLDDDLLTFVQHLELFLYLQMNTYDSLGQIPSKKSAGG